MSLRSLTLNQLLALRALLASMNVSAAAKQCAITQAGMSLTLKKLRSVFADPLIITTGKQATLTYIAKQLMPKLDVLLEHFSKLDANFSLFDPLKNKRHFVIAMPGFYEHLLLEKLIQFTASNNPKITFEITQKGNVERAHELDNWQVDLALILMQSNKHHLQDMLMNDIADEQIFYCLKKTVKKQAALSLEDYLTGHHIIFRNDHTATRGILDDILNVHKKKRNIIGIATNIGAALEAQQKNENIIITAPLSVLKHMQHSYSLVYYPIPFNAGNWTVKSVCHQKNENDQGIIWLSNFLKSIYVS